MEAREEVLRDSIDYLQKRLDFVNDKAEIFIALQTGLFVILAWLFGEFFVPLDETGLLLHLQLAYLLLNFLFIVAVIALLLQTIRPTDGYLSLRTNVEPIETEGLMWPGGEIPGKEEFKRKVEDIEGEDVRRELAGTVYVLHQLVDRTYTVYRWSILVMKVQVVVVPLGFVLLVLLQAMW